MYEQIRQTHGFHPVVVCERRTNSEVFPLTDVFADSDRFLSGAYDLVNRAYRKLNWSNWPGSFTPIVAKYRPRILHAHFGDRGVLMLETAKRCKIPLVTTFYGYDVSKLPQEPKWLPRLRWLFEEGQLFLVEGPAMRDRLIELGCPAEKVELHRLGVDARKIPFATRTAPPNGPIRILMAASFREKKGLRYGIEAYARVAERFPGKLQLTIIGDGPLRAELRARADELGILGQIWWLGFQERGAFLREAARSHIFMAPSVTACDGDTEGGAPVSIIEAQATGLPVLATRHADIPEVTLPDVSAFLVPERDVEALEERLSYLILNPESWAEMGKQGRALVQSKFDSQALGREMGEIYRRLMT